MASETGLVDLVSYAYGVGLATELVFNLFSSRDVMMIFEVEPQILMICERSLGKEW